MFCFVSFTNMSICNSQAVNKKLFYNINDLEYEWFPTGKEKAEKNSFTSFFTWDVPNLSQFLTYYHRSYLYYGKPACGVEINCNTWK